MLQQKYRRNVLTERPFPFRGCGVGRPKKGRGKHSFGRHMDPVTVLAPPPPDPFARCRTLVLDSSYRPIDVINWQRAICLTIFDKVGRPDRPPLPCRGRPEL